MCFLTFAFTPRYFKFNHADKGHMHLLGNPASPSLFEPIKIRALKGHRVVQVSIGHFHIAALTGENCFSSLTHRIYVVQAVEHSGWHQCILRHLYAIFPFSFCFFLSLSLCVHRPRPGVLLGRSDARKVDGAGGSCHHPATASAGPPWSQGDPDCFWRESHRGIIRYVCFTQQITLRQQVNKKRTHDSCTN